MLNLRQLCFTALLLVLFLSLSFQSAVGAGFLTAPRIPTGPDVTSYYTVSVPRFVAVGDFNHDGKLDFVVANPDHDYRDNANQNHSEVSILLGNGDGTFRPAVTYYAGENPFWVVVADLNGDGNLDVVVANGLGGTVSILLGNGDGTFRPPVSYLALVLEPSNPYQQLRSVAIGDFNGDGKPDLAVATAGGGTFVTVLLGNGDGTFQPPKGYATGSVYGSQAISAVVGDFNGDGKLDLALADTDGMAFNGIRILLGNGDGTFHAGISINNGSSALAVADFNGDGKLDLAVGSGILLGNGDGTFQSPAKVPFGMRFITVADLNGDGKPDLAFVAGTNLVGVALGNGDGTFQDVSYLVAGRDTSTVAVGDFNRDHLPDLVAVNGGIVNDASLFLGNGDGTFAAANSFNANTLKPGPSNANSFETAFAGIGDLNNDGEPDLITLSSQPYSNNAFAGVLSGNGDGTFRPVHYFPTGGASASVALGDFNGDGKLDIATANQTSISNPNGDVSVLLGNGDGTLKAPAHYNAGQSPRYVVAGDFNGDGKLDLAVANSTGVSILLGRGDGTFHSPVSFATTFAASCLAAADLNGDGRPDLVFAGSYLNADLVLQSSFGIMLGNGDGTFQVAVNYLGPQYSFFGCPVLADLNHDGKLDLVLPAQGIMGLPRYLLVLLGNGDGTFQPTVSYSDQAPAALGGGPIPVPSVAVADINGDGKPDLVATTDDYVSVFLGNGNGSFQSPLFYDAGYLPGLVAVGDFNRDGAPDVAADTGGSVTILLNTRFAGTASHLSVITPRTTTAGSTFSTTVTAKDYLNLTVANYGSAVHFSSTDAKAALPSSATLPRGFGVFNVNLKTAGIQTVTATDQGNSAITGTSGSIAVSPAAANHYIVTAPASATAGTAFSTTVTAFDPFNNTATGYLGTVYFTSSDGQAVLPANYAFVAGDNGVHTFTNLTTLKTAGVQTLMTGDGFGLWGSSPVLVSPDVTARFAVNAPLRVVTGTPLGVTVAAQDQFGNTTPAYRGTIQFATSAGSATLPSNYTFTNTDPGMHSFSGVVLVTTGNQTITTTDTMTGSINGTSANISVTGSTGTSTNVSSSINPAVFRQSITFMAAVVPTSAPGTVTFMDGTTVLGTSAVDSNGKATFTVTGLSAGTHAIAAIYDGDATYSFSTSAPLTQNRPPAPRKLPKP